MPSCSGWSSLECDGKMCNVHVEGFSTLPLAAQCVAGECLPPAEDEGERQGGGGSRIVYWWAVAAF